MNFVLEKNIICVFLCLILSTISEGSEWPNLWNTFVENGNLDHPAASAKFDELPTLSSQSKVDTWDMDDSWKSGKPVPMYNVPDLPQVSAKGKKATSNLPKCRNVNKPVTIKVNSVDDIMKRARYPPTGVVRLVLQKDIRTDKTIVMGRNFSCTILLSASSGGGFGYQVFYPGDRRAALLITDAANILMYRVGWKIYPRHSALGCISAPVYHRGIHCPAVSIFRSYGIVIARARIQGRVDLAKAAFCRLDSLQIRGLGIRLKNPGIVSIGESGIGPKLIKGGNVVAHCDIAGIGGEAEVGINMYFGAIGNTIANNYVHEWQLFGISGGFGIHTSGNCLFNVIRNNYVYNSKEIWKRGFTGDSGGIYFNLHYLGIGNSLRCNYVKGPGHCYYLDYVTSGVSITGGACIDNDDGIKINNGKENKIKDIIMIRTLATSGYLSCLNADVNNCDKNPGTYWENVRRKYFNSPQINRLFPWLPAICKQTSYKGKKCNPGGKLSPPASKTGRCSGIPTGNFAEWVNVDLRTNKLFKRFLCDDLQVALQLNVVRNRSTPANFKRGLVNNYAAEDFGVPKNSPLNKGGYKFTSCPKSTIGPRRKLADLNYYLKLWNIDAPKWWQEALAYKLVSP